MNINEGDVVVFVVVVVDVEVERLTG